MNDLSDLARRLQPLDVSCLCDAKRTLRVLDAGIRPLVPGLKLVGRAFPVPCCDDFLRVLSALREAQPGDVLIVDGQGGHKALMGELFTTEAKRKGLAGAVIDGAVRDVARVRTLGFPVYARLITPMAGASGSMTSAPIPISCGGVTVLPGDIIIGDDDGIVAVSEAELMDILPAAEAIRRTEAEALRRMAAGESLLDMLNFDEHLDAIRAGRKSQLHFLF